MTNFCAVVVEDDDDQAPFTLDILETSGFTVSHYRDVATLMASIESFVAPVDLFVLDRRLPTEIGDEPEDRVGDLLLDEMVSRFPDSVFIVFTGYADVGHVQFTTRRRGTIRTGVGDPIDRVTHFEKSQSIEFEEHIAVVAEALQKLEDVELRVTPPSASTALSDRVLRRVATAYGGASIKARELTGGLTGSPVWSCDIHGPASPIAEVVVKQTDKEPHPGGIQALLPASIVAASVNRVAGLCGGVNATVYQMAGTDTVSLLELLLVSPDRAAEAVEVVIEAMRKPQPGPECRRSVAEIAAPFESWATAAERLREYAISAPAGSKIASTCPSPQHGDLHPGNILVSTDAVVLIDFDSQTEGSRLLDPVALLLGSIFHRDSPLRNSPWPTAEQCARFDETLFLNDAPAPAFLLKCHEWMLSATSADRELAAVVLAFAARQLKYTDVHESPVVRDKALGLARWAAERLSG